jgi:hypothetical protein
MTIRPIARSERRLRFATHYLDVETRRTSSLERTILQELDRGVKLSRGEIERQIRGEVKSTPATPRGGRSGTVTSREVEGF